MFNSLKEEIEKAICKAGANGVVELTSPPKPEMGDFAFACFGYAKDNKTNPAEAAKKLAEKLAEEVKKIDILDKVEAQGPYVNFYLNNKLLAKKVLEVIDADFGKQKNNHEKILVEFAQPNTHKAFHIGHLRGTITGESLSRIMEEAGYDVKRVNYQGDVGMHIAKALWALLGKKEKVESLKNESIEERVKFLGKAYVEGATAFENDEKAKKEIEEINDKIYKHDKSIEDLYKETRSWSLEYFDGIYKELGTHFDRLFFESETFERGVELVKEFLEKGVFKKSEGAVIFEGSKYEGLHDRVFLNSKGLPTYEAKELALAELQFKEFKPDKVIHVVAKEQTEYFKVVFKAMESVLPQTKGKESHLSFGWVSLKHGKMSSRTGQVVLAEDLIKDVKKKVLSIMKESKVKDKEAVAETVSLAALKYSFLKTSISNDIVFDLDESVSLSGDSGPYLLYIVARINSILKKAGNEGFIAKIFGGKGNVPEKVGDLEKQLLMKLAEFEEIVIKASENNDPSKIAHYLFTLAQLFNNFYHDLPILKADKNDKNFRIKIIKSVHVVMSSGLKLLGIDTVKEM